MQIIECCSLNCINIYSYKPVLRIKLKLGKYAETSSAMIDGFAERLLELMPTLSEHCCAAGYKGGFAERLREGTYPAHIFEHVLLELQNLCGDSVSFGKARFLAEPDIYQVIAAFRDEFTGRSCAFLALELLNALFNGEEFLLAEKLNEIKKEREHKKLGPSAAAIAKAAKERGIPLKRFADDLLIMGYGCRMKRAWSAVSEHTGLLAADIAADKSLTAAMLSYYGLPVPQNALVYDEASAKKAARQIGGSVVVKPLDASHGRGVTVNITGDNEVARAFCLAKKYSGGVLIEKFIKGRQYRLCVVGGRLAAAAERIPAYVIGDGEHTIKELVAIVNAQPLRGDGHNRPLSKMIIDEATLAILEKQHLAPDMVAEKNRIVKIKETANLSTGGTATDVTLSVSLENKILAERAAMLVGLDVAGIDIIADDISRPLDGKNGAIIEINAAPGLRMHHHPTAGAKRDVGGAIVDYLFPHGSDGRIPVAAVTGTNGKTTVTRMLAAIFRKAGFDVGMATTDGIYVNDECQMKGDCSGPASAASVLHDRRVTAAVLETARGGIVRAGLGFDECDIGIVTNITEDHLGQDGIESLDDLFFIKSLILEVTASHGTAVINADDEFAAKLCRRTKAKVVYFTQNENNILVRRHLNDGGRAVILRQGKAFFCEGAKSELLFEVNKLPTALKGKAAHNVENALAAAAAAAGFGIDAVYIGAALKNFAENHGRLKMFAAGGILVCVDYGHNAAGIQAMLKMAQQMDKKRLIGVIGAPGDRRDDVIARIGALAGQGFDYVYIKEDEDKRGRKLGEAARLLEQGVREGRRGENNFSVILDEGEAVDAALKNAVSGDFIIIFYENYELVAAKIAAWERDIANQSEDAPPEMAHLNFNFAESAPAPFIGH
jgi:cyanophycin synthetase